jgi:hypothetical protein
MKSIVISQADFEAIESSAFSFQVEETNREFENHQYANGIDDDGNTEYADCYNSFVAGEATAKHGDLEIEFWWVANGGNKTYKDAFDFTIEIDYNGPKNYETNFSIVDDDGDEIDGWEFDDILKEKLDGAEWEYEVKRLLPTADDEIEDLDTDEDKDMTEEMKEYVIERDNGPSIKFTGTHVAGAGSSANNAAGSSYSGETGRWCELDLYKTKGGKFVCAQVGYTQWQGERNRYSAAVCESEAEVIKFFGQGWLAKRLYENAEIENVVEIE